MKSLNIATTSLLLLAAVTIVISASNGCDGDNECDHYCENSTGSYNCSCRDGFNLTDDGNTCEDIDECEANEGLGNCSQSCNNFNGTYNCSCIEGYILSADNTSCDDINECTAKNSGRGDCQHSCGNLVGSYNCSCKEGFKLKADNKTCEDVNECASCGGKGDCDHACTNLEGSYRCSCRGGFTLNTTDNITCQDINECEANDGLGECDHFCNNTEGSHICSCKDEYSLMDDNTNCQDNMLTCYIGNGDIGHHHLPKQRGFTCCLKTVTSKPVLLTTIMYSGSNDSRTCKDYCLKHVDLVSTIDCTCDTNLCNSAPGTLLLSVISVFVAAFVFMVLNIFTILGIV